MRLFVWHAFGVKIPSKRVCKNHCSPWEAFADAYFARHSPVHIWKGSRGLAGKTYLLSLLGLVEALSLGCRVNLLGGSGEQSRRILEAQEEYWQHPQAPRYMLRGDTTQQRTRLKNRGQLNALMASARSVRGPHPARLLLDEIDEMKQSIFDSALGQPQHPTITPHLVGSSTHHHASGTMTHALKQAREKGWRVYEWCYKETLEPHGWLTHEMVESKRSMMTTVDWETEVELQEPNPGARAIDPNRVNAMFVEKLGRLNARPLGEKAIFEKPVPGARYAIGTDWAKTTDWTVIVVLRTDPTPMRLVAFERTGRLPWNVIVPKLDQWIKYYARRGARYHSTHDSTGMGKVIHDYLTKKSEGFDFVGRPRSELLSEYCNACEKGEIRAPFIEFMHGEHLYASRDDVFRTGTKEFHLPDSIAAGALAYRASKKPKPRIA